MKHTVAVVTHAHVLQNFYTTWVRDVACQKQRLGVKLEEGAGLEKHPENLGPPMYFCNRRSWQLQIWYTTWVWD